MSDRLVTVASFSNAIEANIARNALEEAGIPACLADEEMVNALSLLSNILGGVKLLVRESDGQAACSLLNELNRPEENSSDVV